MTQSISNPASALGEAVGHIIQNELTMLICKVASSHGYSLRSSGENSKKLLMKDRWGNVYDIDMAIFDSKNNPIVLIESKYLRYKKHMRDKASWICVAHSNLRDTYPTIRSCIAVLIGDWTKGAKRLLASHKINILEIPFTHITDVLAEHKIEFRWGEKEREKALKAWEKFQQIGNQEKLKIGKKFVKAIEKSLTDLLNDILTIKKSLAIASLEMKVTLNDGSRHIFTFNKTDEVLTFLSNFDLKKINEYHLKKDTLDAYMKMNK
jgi:hypothetical protein